MNRITLITAALAATAAFATPAAFAQEATSDAWMAVPSTATRAQVQADLVQARRDGSLKMLSAGYLPTLASTRTRAEVRAELERARASGEFEALNAEVPSAVRARPVLVAQAAR